MRKEDCHEAALETLNDMARAEPGDPYAGHRVILGPALRMPAGRRKEVVRRVFSDLLALTYYAQGSAWNHVPEYRRVLVNLALDLCEEIEQHDRDMREMSKRQVKRVRETALDAAGI